MRSLSCSFLASSSQQTLDCLMGHAVISGHLSQGVVVFTDTAHHVRPFFRWDAMVRLAWARILLFGSERGNTSKHLLEGEESLIKLAVWGKEVN